MTEIDLSRAEWHKSSFSGQDYLVQCPGAEAMPSASWLKAELVRFRQIPRS